MRLLSRKIYRAYPELDHFDDAVCKRYVRYARRAGRAWWEWALYVLVVPISMVFWAFLLWLFFYPLSDLFPSHRGPMEIIEYTTQAIFVSGISWFPLMCMLLLRDRLLGSAIRRRLASTTCEQCGYSLVGLSVEHRGDDPFVRCPECGTNTMLNEGHITEADINPALLAESTTLDEPRP